MSLKHGQEENQIPLWILGMRIGKIIDKEDFLFYGLVKKKY